MLENSVDSQFVNGSKHLILIHITSSLICQVGLACLATVQRSYPDRRVQLLKFILTQSDVTDTLEIGALKLLSSKGQSHDVSGIWH